MQYVLDLDNPKALEYAYESTANILRSTPITYVKWDINRQLNDNNVKKFLFNSSIGLERNFFIINNKHIQLKLFIKLCIIHANSIEVTQLFML
ncbi:alpha-galactosidase [Sporanaerobium hydrogeniformans]|uniref:alpha-galactosidase n=1 Tax=Sporanaerobium hydrogeniformans TaxID=3072179 RepID=UPI00268DD3BC